jgi:molybdopterin-guanine dinucleotide biosynthesis protein A
VTAAVLAGGAARRYGGQPKGLRSVGGRRILDVVVELLTTAVGQSPLLIANAPDAATWRPDLRTIPDARPGLGTLGGIFTAVTAAAGRPVLCLAWDMPFARIELLEALLAKFRTGSCDAVLPESEGRRGLEPLCAIYGPACAPAIARRLDQGDLRAIAFHPDVRVGILPLAEVQRYGDPVEQFFNVNTPDDLARAEAIWQRRG